MVLRPICLIIKLILMLTSFFPIAAFAHLISITATTPFPSTVRALSTTSGIFTVTNLTSRVALTVIDQSHFPKDSGLSIVSSTCGSLMNPGQTCNITVQLQAPSTSQTLSVELREWAKPSADGVRFPFSIAVVGLAQSTGLIAVGNYKNTSTIQTPLIFLSPSGSAWSPVSTTLPSDFSSNGLLASSSCTGINCIGAGIYNNGAVNKPLIVFTSNAGSSWSSVTAPVPVNFASSASVKASTCEGSTCVVNGIYLSNTAALEILLLVSKDSGNTWSTVTPTLPAHNLVAQTSVVCTGNTCIAGGNYTDTSNVELPLLLVSNNSGTSWTAATLPLPTGYLGLGGVNSLACEGAHCVAGGTFLFTGIRARPLIYISNNLGASWTLPTTINLPLDYVSLGFLNAVACTGGICNGAGNYSNGAITKPLFLHSIDNGNNWSSVTPLSLPSNFSDSTSLRSIVCTGSNCMAAGDYADSGFIQFPVLFVSSNQGASWTSFALTLPADFSDLGTINALNCSGGVCVAVGDYTNTSNIELPLIYVSINSGITWSIIAPTLPANFSDLGVLNSTSGTL